MARSGWSKQRPRQMRKLPYYHTFSQKVPEITVDLAEKLVGMAPVPMSKAFFSNSGSEANDTAVKMIWYYNNALGRPQKKKIIARIKGYHGVTVAAASPDRPADTTTATSICRSPISCTPTARIYYRFGKPGESEEQFATPHGREPGRR